MRSSRNVTVLHDLLSQKQEHDIHLQRLSQIRDVRKKSLSEHLTAVDKIKQYKRNTFAQKLFKEDTRIAAQNQRLFIKLNRTMTNRIHTDSSSFSARGTRTPKRDYSKTMQQDNRRLFTKIKTVSSFIDSRQIAADYEKTLQIKNRLRKYDRSCELKCRKYASVGAILNSRVKGSVQTTIPRPAISTVVPPFKSKIASHYRKEDIIKNKVQFKMPNKLRAVDVRNKRRSFFQTQVIV